MGSARVIEGRWKDAEASLEQSINIFDEQILKALHSDSEFFRTEHRKNLEMSAAQSQNLLAIAYFRDGRERNALKTLEKAYQEALQSSATPEMIEQIIERGRGAAKSMEDAAAQEKWGARTAPLAKSQP